MQAHNKLFRKLSFSLEIEIDGFSIACTLFIFQFKLTQNCRIDRWHLRDDWFMMLWR